MLRSTLRLVSILFVSAMVAVSVGCGSAEDVIDPLGATQADVESASTLAAVAGPSADVAGDMILEMLQLVDASPSPATLGRGATAPSCPSSFDLGNGITGTCMATSDGAEFSFGGSLTIDGGSVTVCAD